MERFLACCIVGLLLLILFGFIKSSADCSAAGGEMVRTMSGIYKCVELKEIDE